MRVSIHVESGSVLYDRGQAGESLAGFEVRELERHYAIDETVDDDGTTLRPRKDERIALLAEADKEARKLALKELRKAAKPERKAVIDTLIGEL